jgi:hypothetical protein
MGILQQSPVAQAIAEKIVNPALASRAQGTSGEIVNYYAASNTADVEIYVKGKRMRQYGLTMPHNAGTIGCDPVQGDQVWIEHLGDNQRKPFVIMKFDSNYQYATGQGQQTTQQALTPSNWGQS